MKIIDYCQYQNIRIFKEMKSSSLLRDSDDGGSDQEVQKNSKRQSLKRKVEGTEDQPTLSKRQQKKLKRKGSAKSNQKAQQDDVDEESGINEAIGKMDKSLLADYVAKQIARFEPDLSDLEVEERRISGRSSPSRLSISGPWQIYNENMSPRHILLD